MFFLFLQRFDANPESRSDLRSSHENDGDAKIDPKLEFAQTQNQFNAGGIGISGTYSSTQSLARYLPQDPQDQDSAGLYAQHSIIGSPPMVAGRPPSTVGHYTQQNYPQPPAVENQPYPVHVDARHGPMQEFIPSNVSALRERFNDSQHDAHFKPIIAKQVVRAKIILRNRKGALETVRKP